MVRAAAFHHEPQYTWAHMLSCREHCLEGGRMRTYIIGIEVAVELVNADAFNGLAPVLTIGPHGRCGLQIELSRAEEPPMAEM